MENLQRDTNWGNEWLLWAPFGGGSYRRHVWLGFHLSNVALMHARNQDWDLHFGHCEWYDRPSQQGWVMTQAHREQNLPMILADYRPYATIIASQRYSSLRNGFTHSNHLVQFGEGTFVREDFSHLWTKRRIGYSLKMEKSALKNAVRRAEKTHTHTYTQSRLPSKANPLKPATILISFISLRVLRFLLLPVPGRKRTWSSSRIRSAANSPNWKGPDIAYARISSMLYSYYFWTQVGPQKRDEGMFLTEAFFEGGRCCTSWCGFMGLGALSGGRSPKRSVISY